MGGEGGGRERMEEVFMGYVTEREALYRSSWMYIGNCMHNSSSIKMYIHLRHIASKCLMYNTNNVGY